MYNVFYTDPETSSDLDFDTFLDITDVPQDVIRIIDYILYHGHFNHFPKIAINRENFGINIDLQQPGLISLAQKEFLELAGIEWYPHCIDYDNTHRIGFYVNLYEKNDSFLVFNLHSYKLRFYKDIAEICCDLKLPLTISYYRDIVKYLLENLHTYKSVAYKYGFSFARNTNLEYMEETLKYLKAKYNGILYKPTQKSIQNTKRFMRELQYDYITDVDLFGNTHVKKVKRDD